MSYPSNKMLQTDTTQHAMNVSLTNAQLPQMLRQSNYLATGDLRTANVNFRVKPHTTNSAAPVAVERAPQTTELYPTQSTPRTSVFEHEHDWSKHEIVASVAGLRTKLTDLDTEIRSGACADAAGASVLRQVQDHANLLRENAKVVSATQSKHKEVTSLTHKILSQMHDSTQQHAATLGTFNDDIAKLKTTHKACVGLTHDICSELQQGQLQLGDESKGVQLTLLEHKEALSLLTQKDVVAQALLSKMLAMLDHHDSALSTGKAFTAQDQTLLNAFCETLEKTKSKMQTFEQTQRDMQKVLADYKANRLATSGAYDAEALQAKLARYERLSSDIDRQCTQALQQHGARMEELQRAHERALHDQRMKMQQLEQAQRQAVDEQQGKMQLLERKLLASQSEYHKIADLEGKVQQLALQQLNSSQNASTSRTTERDLKFVQHDLKQLHGLRKDVEKLQADNSARTEHSLTLHKDMQQVKSGLKALADTHKSGADVQAKLLDVQRELTLSNIRHDKTATSIHQMQCKLAA